MSQLCAGNDNSDLCVSQHIRDMLNLCEVIGKAEVRNWEEVDDLYAHATELASRVSSFFKTPPVKARQETPHE